MNTETLDLAASRAALGLLQSDDFARVGVEALLNGYDSPSLRILAGMNALDSEEARGMFDRALSELHVAVPGKRDAVMKLAQETAKGILAGTTGVYRGAKQIWNLTLCAMDEDFPELDTFVYAASEWEDRPEDRPVFEEGIVEAARELLES